MRRMIVAVVGGMLAVITAAPASAAIDPADVRCLLSAASLVGSKDQGQQTIGLLASLYFAGKVYAGSPSRETVREIAEKEARRLGSTGIAAELQRCGAEMEARGKEIKDLSRELGAELSSPPTAEP